MYLKQYIPQDIFVRSTTPSKNLKKKKRNANYQLKGQLINAKTLKKEVENRCRDY